MSPLLDFSSAKLNPCFLSFAPFECSNRICIIKAKINKSKMKTTGGECCILSCTGPSGVLFWKLYSHNVLCLAFLYPFPQVQEKGGRCLLKYSCWLALAFLELLFLTQGNWCLLVCFISVANEEFSLRLCNCFLILS